LTDLFGARKVGIFGGLISTFGLLTSAMVQQIEIYFLTYSFVFGLGQALMLTATLAILPHYFNKVFYCLEKTLKNM
jgi:MFS transporter, MCT family, solute carrier family 16 (monocarboxylic acid transporters), member 10